MKIEPVWTELLRQHKEAGKAADLSMKERRLRLLCLRSLVIVNETQILAALQADLGKSEVEAYASEIAVVLNELEYLLKILKQTLTDKPVRSRPGQHAVIRRKPFGSVLILSPWNYPFLLAMLPLAGALACGNRCFLKPSEQAPHTAALLERLISQSFTPDTVYVANGTADTAQALLTLSWDFIFFTGSESIGRKVALAAAQNLVPCVLELGGKCPCIVDAGGASREAARRIVWGKFLNAGQTCVAPDHILVSQDVYEPFLVLLREQIHSLFGEQIADSPDYGRIINHQHLARLIGLLEGGKAYFGGETDPDKLYMEPVLLTDILPDSPVMTQEIFGPILPVIPYADQAKMLEDLRNCPAPLATYVFSQNQELLALLQAQVQGGALCAGHVVRHVGRSDLPFGGVGTSGYGRYHGKASLLTFSYEQVVCRYRLRPDARIEYPPYTRTHFRFLKRLRKMLL